MAFGYRFAHPDDTRVGRWVLVDPDFTIKKTKHLWLRNLVVSWGYCSEQHTTLSCTAYSGRPESFKLNGKRKEFSEAKNRKIMIYFHPENREIQVAKWPSVIIAQQRLHKSNLQHGMVRFEVDLACRASMIGVPTLFDELLRHRGGEYREALRITNENIDFREVETEE
jgi:hypothetical protein